MSELSAHARRVLEARYLARNQAGGVGESFEDLCRRVAAAVAAAERVFGGEVDRIGEELERLLISREFLPNSPSLMNAGTSCGQLAACFVLPSTTMDGPEAEAHGGDPSVRGGTGFSHRSGREATRWAEFLDRRWPGGVPGRLTRRPRPSSRGAAGRQHE
jgi:ribonucleoside-diphosphate reductase alpha chain